jgi:hypothetical protein
MKRTASHAKIKALLDEADGRRLAKAWQWVYPRPIGSEAELPDRPGMVEDLADFAEVVLQGSLDGLTVDRLCKLTEECGTLRLRHPLEAGGLWGQAVVSQ